MSKKENTKKNENATVIENENATATVVENENTTATVVEQVEEFHIELPDMGYDELSIFANTAFENIRAINSSAENSTLKIARLLYGLKANNCHFRLVAKASDKGKFAKYAMSELSKRGVDYKRASVNMLARAGEYVNVDIDGFAHSVWGSREGDFKPSMLGQIITGFKELTTEQIIPTVQKLLDDGEINFTMKWKELADKFSALSEWDDGKKKLTAGEGEGEANEGGASEGGASEGEGGQTVDYDTVNIDDMPFEECLRQARLWFEYAKTKANRDVEKEAIKTTYESMGV